MTAEKQKTKMPQDVQPKEIPAPVRLAREALEILKAEGRAVAEIEKLAKTLPAFAMNLERSGEEVTVDVLLAHARTGDLNLKRTPEPKKQRTYEDIVAKFSLSSEAIVKEVLPPKDLFEAAHRGDLKGVKKFLASGATVDAKDAYGHTALILAAWNSNADVVRLLIEQHAKVDEKDNKGMTALMMAALNGNLDVARLLIKNGANVNQMNKSGRTVLIYAVDSDDTDMLHLLLKNGAHANLYLLTTPQTKRLENYAKACTQWQKTTYIDPPSGLYEENPAYFSSKAFEAVRVMLEKEGGSEKGANRMAFGATGLFGTEDRVLHYLEQWGKAGKQPLHDIIYDIKLPGEKTPGMDLTAWADAVMKCGPSMAKLVKFADKLPVPEKSADGQTWS
ncbi:MAG: ankyrin repeat domain-containing protein, partial [Proteobacteria bacterium]|nr:ankyrin repeat domain-containing protein [Pseudomonadota bacterium]